MEPMTLGMLLARGDAVLDGGLATELEARGHDLRDPLWSAKVLRDDPQAIVDVHRAYFEAGADVATTASYQAPAGELIGRSVELARRARDDAGRGLVVGSVGPYAALRADGSEYTGDYGDTSDEAIAVAQRPRLAALVDSGADAIAFETVPNAREAVVAAGLLEEHPGIEAWLSFCCRDGEHLSDGTPIGEAIRAADSDRVTAFGINCTPPQHVESLLRHARSATSKPLVVYPNHGATWDEATYTWSGPASSMPAPAVVRRWRDAGAAAVGGCCGIGPAAIAALRAST